MLKFIPTGRFRKDYALMVRRGKDMTRLKAVIDQIAYASHCSNDTAIMPFLVIGKVAGTVMWSQTGC